MSFTVKPILWTGQELQLLDQRLLPQREEYVSCKTPDDVASAIRAMVVRGAPAIGVAAAYAMVLAAGEVGAESGAQSPDASGRGLPAAAALLKASRPTAVNLAWAVERMLRAASAHRQGNLRSALEREAVTLHEEDIAANRAIGGFGQELLRQSSTVLTHCNAGALATGGYGTALGVIRSAVEHGKRIAVFAGETRPWLQGARLTAWELQRDGIDVTLISDSMSGHFFQKGTFDAVIVGADRIAMNGDVANKIGTYTLAVLAHAHSVPFYVAAPISTVDRDCASGEAIPIEERSEDEVRGARGFDESGAMHVVQFAPDNVAARHPVFDITPARYVTAIISERGVVRAPYEESLKSLFV